MTQRTIGFLTFDIAGTYNYKMWKHLAQAAKKNNVNLISFCGGILHGESSLQMQWNKIFDLANCANVDGLIVLSASIAQRCGTSELARFLSRYENIPIVSLGLKLPKIPSVLVDNVSGMTKLMEHLIVDHKIKRPFFLMGPQNNDEALSRLNAFMNTMKKYNVPIDSDYIKNAEFRYDYAIQIVDRMIENNYEFDAIISVNDDMAIGALDTLVKNGIEVPHDVLVTGFDDSESAPYCQVSLTTVSQPHEELAEKSIEIMLDILNNKEYAEVTCLDSELVIRKSCGCFKRALRFIPTFTGTIPVVGPDEFLSRNIFTDLKYKAIFNTNPIYSGEYSWKDTLWLKFTTFLTTADDTEFLQLLDNILRSVEIVNEKEIALWHDFIFIWHNICNEQYKYDPELLQLIESCFTKVRFLLFDFEKSIHAHHRRKSQQRDFLLVIFNSYFSPVMDINNFLLYLHSELPKFGVKAFYVNLFEKNDLKRCRHFMRFTDRGDANWSIQGELFNSVELVPGGIKSESSSNYIIQPLINYEEIIGFLIFQINEPIELIENVRQIVSSSLISIMLVQEVMRDKQLKIMNSNLQAKQCELEIAYKSLKENQDKMLIIEKMASLGRMSAGIAHEMNSPLAAVGAALMELDGLILEYSKSIKDENVSLDDHSEIVTEMERAISIAKLASTKAISFVHGIKAQTRDLGPKDQIVFNAVDVIDEALLLLGHAIKYGNCKLEFTHKIDTVKLLGVPGRMAQIITNMVTNAIDACENKPNSKIQINLSIKESNIILSVSDNGCGIPEKNMNKIFDPMFTSKPFGVGTGLGLTLVHDIVTVDFSGVIQVDSTPGIGTVFTMVFPVVK